MELPQSRLLKLRHQCHAMGFLSARICVDCGVGWTLRVESPEDVGVYLDHLHSGASMELSMVTRDGDAYRGEASVATVSLDGDVGTLVVLCGVGPLQGG